MKRRQKTLRKRLAPLSELPRVGPFTLRPRFKHAGATLWIEGRPEVYRLTPTECRVLGAELTRCGGTLYARLRYRVFMNHVVEAPQGAKTADCPKCGGVMDRSKYQWECRVCKFIAPLFEKSAVLSVVEKAEGR